jgi:hypothetical protein
MCRHFDAEASRSHPVTAYVFSEDNNKSRDSVINRFGVGR